MFGLEACEARAYSGLVAAVHETEASQGPRKATGGASKQGMLCEDGLVQLQAFTAFRLRQKLYIIIHPATGGHRH